MAASASAPIAMNELPSVGINQQRGGEGYHGAADNMYAQLLPLAFPAPPMPGMGGPGVGGFVPPPQMGGGMGMPPMPPFSMPPMGSY